MDPELLTVITEDRTARYRRDASNHRIVHDSGRRRTDVRVPARRRAPRQRLGLALVSVGQRLIGPHPG